MFEISDINCKFISFFISMDQEIFEALPSEYDESI